MANTIDRKINPEIPIMQESNRNEVYVPNASYTEPGVAGFLKTHFIVDDNGIVHLRKAPERAVSAVTYDSNTNTLIITFDDGTVQSIKLNDCACVDGTDLIVYDAFNVISFEIDSWDTLDAGKVLVVSAAMTGYDNDEIIAQLDKYNVVTTNAGDKRVTSNYQTDSEYQIYKCTDGSLVIFATEAFAGRFIILKREFAVQKNVANITYDDATGTLTIYYVTGGSVEVFVKTNMQAGEGEGSTQQIGAKATGKQAAAFGENTKQYQKAGFVAGNNSTTGMTEEEFNAWYWDSTNNKPLHSGHGKINGKITNEIGENYTGSTSFGATFGQNNRGFERNTLTHGDSNDNRSESGFASGNSNYQEGLADRVSGQFNKLNARNSQADGYRNYVGYEVSDDGKTITPLEFETIRDSSATGTRNVVSHTGSHLKGLGLKTGRIHQVAVGEANAGKADTLFEVGHGTYNEVSEEITSRANALEVTEKNSLAVGGKRYDKQTGRTPTSADGNQAFAAGGSVHAHGDFSAAIGKDVNSYQKCAIAAGGGCEAGLTEAEFNALYPNGVNEDGETYEKSYSLGVAMGENAKAKGRGAVALGSNVKADRYGAAFGSQNQAGKRALVGGDNNDSTGENTFTTGRGNKNTQQFANVMGNGNESTAPLQTIVGSYAEKNQYKRFQVGVGQADNNRKDAFSVWTDGRASVEGAPQESHDVVRKQELDSLAGNGLQRTSDGKLQVKAGANLSFSEDGTLNVVGGGAGNEYANTSEIVDNAITLTSTSTLNDLVSQILANKTKVTRSFDETNLNRILGAPKYTVIMGVTFKVVNSHTISDASEPCYYPDVIIECFGWGTGHYYKQYIVNYLSSSSAYSAAPSLTGWVELSTDYNPYPVGSIYITTDPSTSSPCVTYFGGTWEKIGTTGLPEVVWTHDIIKDIPYGQGVEMIRTLIPANTSAYIYGSTCSNVSEYDDIMSCAINVIKASDESPVDHYISYARTTMGAGGGASISFYFPAVGYDCYAVLNTYGYRGETTSMTGNLQVVKIPQNQYVWKRIA